MDTSKNKISNKIQQNTKSETIAAIAKSDVPNPPNTTSSKRRRHRKKKSSKSAQSIEPTCNEIDLSADKIKHSVPIKIHEDLSIKKIKNNTQEINKEKVFKNTLDTSQQNVTKVHFIENTNKLDSKHSIVNENTVINPIETKNITLNSITKPTIMEQQNTEKSREEIKAMREAKKLAKQMTKNKIKDPIECKTSNAVSNELIKNVKINAPTKEQAPITTQSEQKQINIKEKENVVPVIKEIVPPNAVEKSKSELRAERRAKQEAQRAAKAQAATENVIVKEKNKPSDNKKVELSNKAKPLVQSVPKVEIKKSTTPDKQKVVQYKHKVKLFNHLYVEEDEKFHIPINSKDIPPLIVRLGIQYKSHIIVGSNARCVALLNTLLKVIKEYIVPPNVEFSRGFEAHLDICMKFLNSCRPLAVSMSNATKYIKSKLRKLPHDMREDDAKSKICEYIETYITEQIDTAGEAISNMVNEKITDGDIILTYGCSSLIERILVDAAAKPNKTFSVVIVAANPWNEGSEMLRRLVKKDIKCSLVMISALSFIMRKIDKVILGAGALLANGYVMARAGTAQVAMVAHTYNVPVLVCCETHKFSERAQTDSFVYNEIGSPDDLFKGNMGVNNSVSNWRAYDTLTPLHLKYDVTPPDLVNAVVTELAILPCTSVPVVLRVRPTDL